MIRRLTHTHEYDYKGTKNISAKYAASHGERIRLQQEALKSKL